MNFFKFSFCMLVLSSFMLACTNSIKMAPSYTYKPDDRQLYDTIAHLDSVFFEAYNTCNFHLDEYAAFYADSIEFYHDKGGMMNVKKEIVESTKKYVCGKVTRELIKGSIEVYPIKGYGAVEMGLHKFHNNQEPDTMDDNSPTGRFIIIWQHINYEWKIRRVISLH